jgi:redox-sensitive bicupin YhaK (pirin superfamily)
VSNAATAQVATIIDARSRDLGGFTVGRVLPSAARRLVGPFIFFDHMGPAEITPGRGLDVRPHPHIGHATVTYLLEGEIVHRNSLGSHQPIRPMTRKPELKRCSIPSSLRRSEFGEMRR